MALRIGVDLDGVLYPFDKVFLDYCVARGRATREEIKPVDRLDFFVDYGFTGEQFVEFCEEGIEEDIIFSRGAPYPDIGAIDELSELGDIYIITHRLMRGAEVATRYWCARWLIPYRAIHFAKDKTSVETDYMIEDNIENYDALDKAGCFVYLVNRPWNQMDDTRRRIDSLHEFVEAVKNDVGNKAQKIGSGTT